MKKNQLIISKRRILIYFIYLSFLICWQSISTKFEDIFIIFQKTIFELTLIEILNFIRHCLIYIIFIPLVVLNVSFFKKFHTKKNDFYKWSFFFAVFYFFLQLPGLIITNNSLSNIYLIVSSLNIIMIFSIANFYLSKKENKIFIYISIFFLILIFLLVYPNILSVLIEGKVSFYGYFKENDILFLNKSSPRSTGIARTLLFILILTDYIRFSLNIKNRYYVFDIIRIFIFYNIFLFQSRTMIVLALVLIIFILLFENKFELKIIIKNLLKYLALPIFLVYITIQINYYVLNKVGDIGVLKVLNNTSKVVIKNLATRKVIKDNFSSGRVQDWKEIIQKINSQFLTGYGAQGDRYLINQTASNGILYALVSSGVIGLFCYVIFTLMILYKSLKNIVNFKIEYEKKLISLGILIILARSIFESSYALFSVDLILLFSILIMTNDNKRYE